MGRHVIGYEVQKVLAAVDWFAQDEDHPPIGVFGYGEGGLLALYSGASTRASTSTVVSGYFGPRESLHDEPIYRNVWGLLKEFGDGEVMRADRAARDHRRAQPVRRREPPAARPGRRRRRAGHRRRARRCKRPCSRSSGSPRRVPPRMRRSAQADRRSRRRRPCTARRRARHGPDGRQRRDDAASCSAIEATLELADIAPRTCASSSTPPRGRSASSTSSSTSRRSCCPTPTSAARSSSGPSSTRRRSRSSRSRRSRSASYFWEEVIGKLPEPTMPLNPRTRLIYDDAEVEGLRGRARPLRRRLRLRHPAACPRTSSRARSGPCVVCQHGLEGRPTDVVNPKKKTPYYNSFGAQLADRGYIVFAPQNPYIGENDFRQVVAQGQPARAVAVLLHRPPARAHPRLARRRCRSSMPSRIAFYGLSYGGKMAMRVPAILLRLLPVDLLGRLQRVDLEERHARLGAAATCSPANTRCTSSTWATPSTTRRWPP